MDIEAVKAFLATDEGKAILTPMIDEAKQPLLTKRDELLGELTGHKEKVRKYEELGDVDTIAQALAKLKEGKPADDKNNNKGFEELERHLRGELQSKEDKLNQFKNKFVADHVQAQLNAEIAAAKGVPELLTPVLKGRIEAAFDDDKGFVITVLGADGKKMYKNGEPATLTDLINEVKANEVYGRAFEGSGASGSGTRPSDGKTNGVVLDPKDPNYSLAKAMAYYKRHPNAIPKK